MKNYTRDEILAYAKRQVEHNEQQSCLTLFFSALILLALGYFICELRHRVETLPIPPLEDWRFLAGVGVGVFFIMLALAAACGVINGSRRTGGIGHQALKRLIELEERQVGQQSHDPDPSTEPRRGSGKATSQA